MKPVISMLLAAMFLFTISASAGNLCKTPVSKLLKHADALSLTDGQVRKLQIVEDTAVQKMTEAKVQADIRLAEIEKFTCDWTNMNGTAVRTLLKEYYNFMAEYKSAELNAICQARAILDFNQLTRFQQLVSIESLILNMESEIALR